MFTVNEKIFNCIMTKINNTEIKDEYYPTVEELKILVNEDNMNLYLPIIIYFSKDPYGDIDKFAGNEEYQELVMYCEDFLDKKIEIVAA